MHWIIVITFLFLAQFPTVAYAQRKPIEPKTVPTRKQSPQQKRSAGHQPIQVKVAVLNFDPIVSLQNKPLHEFCGWNDPRQLAEEYAADIKSASGNFIEFVIVDWKDLDAFPPKKDGFIYTMETYLKCRSEGKGWHEPDELDYPRVLRESGLLPKIDSGEIDEIWIFGAPYFGYWESAMAGPGAFYINGGVYPEVPTKKPFAIMGFNYERGVAEMLHDLCHRTEATMARIYGGWEANKLEHNWAKFAANATQSNGVAACGTCHYPPNAEKDYDYANPRYVDSSADDWLNYPKLTGKKKKINCEAWGGPDHHRNYMKWWFTRLPKAPGENVDGRQNNWWKYVFDFNSYTEQGRPK